MEGVFSASGEYFLSPKGGNQAARKALRMRARHPPRLVGASIHQRLTAHICCRSGFGLGPGVLPSALGKGELTQRVVRFNANAWLAFDLLE